MEGHDEKSEFHLQLQVPNKVLGSYKRYMQDYLNPTRVLTPSCIIVPKNAHTFVIIPGMLPSFSTVQGMKNESPYLHVKEFEKMV